MKKKLTLAGMRNFPAHRQFLLVMRLTVFLIVFSVAAVMANTGHSQEAKITLQLKNATLSDVLEAIESNSSYYFMLNNKLIDLSKKIDFDVKDKMINDILALLSKKAGIKYKIYDHQIVLSPEDIKLSDVSVSQQQKNVTGIVTDSSGAPLPGVSVVLKGTINGTITDANGKFSLSNIPPSSSILFSFVGMKTEERSLEGLNHIDVTMKEDAIGVDEVVVTALGLKMSAKKLTYATQTVQGSELTKVPDPNLMNTLSGKVAGLSIAKAPGVGASVKVQLRGSRSIQGNNQPLFIIDGVPMSSNGGQVTNNLFSGYDAGGDGISNLNPDDIESINILKGASAAALYGSQAANGVVVITTKKGKAGVANITVNSSTTMEEVSYLPKLQKTFGQTATNSIESWGEKVDTAPDNLANFYDTGVTTVNSVSLSTGNDRMQTFMSYANTHATGVLSNNKLNRHNVLLTESGKFFDNKLSVEGSMQLTFQKMENPPVSGRQMNPIVEMYGFPVGMSVDPYRKEFEVWNPERKIMKQNWYVPINGDNQNPYWVMNRMNKEFDRQRTTLRVSLKYDFNDWLNLQLRGNMDKTHLVFEEKNYSGSAEVYGFKNGYYGYNERDSRGYYGDVLLNINHSFASKFDFEGLLGASISDSQNQGVWISSGSLHLPNVFLLNNMEMNNMTALSTEPKSHSQLQSVFGSATLTYNDWLTTKITGRNDWSSNLSYTSNVSFFYPSFGISALMHKIIKLPEAISFAKLHSSYAIVGNTVPIYVTNPPAGFISSGVNISFNTIAPFKELMPEKSKSFELGVNLKLFDYQLDMDILYYKTHTTNQFFQVAVPPGTGYAFRYVNGGNIQNSGVEANVSYTPLIKGAFKWTTTMNFSKNKNKVIELTPEFDQFIINDDLSGYSSILKVGGSYGDIYGQKLKKDDQGRVVISNTGLPVGSGKKDFLGSPNPDFKLGWNNSFQYKNLSLSFLIDGNIGGKVMSLTQMRLDGIGVSKASGDARLNGGVKINGVIDGTNTEVKTVDAYRWYSALSSQSIVGEYMYDATTIRLREVVVGYSLPRRLLSNTPVKNIRLSLIGRNLFYFYKPAPFDSDITYTTGNSYAGVEYFSTPAVRSIGFSLNVGF
jgi:TonB-linked SusC/RagA family outer membrane protein